MVSLKTASALASLAMIGAATSAASASVDRSPKPGGVYRLKPGLYVDSGASCGSPANASIRRYDGRGLSGAHSRDCRATILSRKSGRYVVSQSCIAAGSGPAPRVTERQTVTVRDALTFTLQAQGRGATYRYCPIDQLPTGLKEVAR